MKGDKILGIVIYRDDDNATMTHEIYMVEGYQGSDEELEDDIIEKAAEQLGYDDWTKLADQTKQVMIYRQNALNQIFDQVQG
jgi:hypothetical protein